MTYLLSSHGNVTTPPLTATIHALPPQVDGPLHFTSGRPARELGATVARRRLLASRGCPVVNVACDDWDPLEHQQEATAGDRQGQALEQGQQQLARPASQAQLDYLRALLETAVGH